MSTLLVLSDMLLSSVLLDPLSAIAYGEVFFLLLKWGCLALVAVVLLVGFILLMRLDSKSTQEEPVQSIQAEPVQMRGEDYFQCIAVAVAVLIVFGIWFFR
jgi:hypothetical protein